MNPFTFLLYGVVFQTMAAAASQGQLSRLPLHFEPAGASPTRFQSQGSGRLLVVDVPGTDLTIGDGRVPSATIRMRLRGAARTATPMTSDSLNAKANYLVGNAPAQWRTGISSYGRVGYRGVYPGIDVTYYGHEGMLEYDFHVAAGSDPRAIRMTYSGTSRPRIESNGDLVLETAAGEIRHHKPVVYQELAGARREVDGRYRIHSSREVGFEVGAYDHNRPLVIDPVVTFATYFGGSKGDSGRGIAVDAAGNVYVSGTTFSTDLPASRGALQSTLGGVQDVFISKLDVNGNLVFTTYLGGNDGESVAGLALDPQGNIIVAGFTSSNNFPTSDNALQKFNRGGFYIGSDGYVTKLDPTGSKVLYSSYIGGNDDELLLALAVDRSGFVYLAGATVSTNFPTTVNAYQKGNRSLAAFVSKVDTQSGQLVYSTYVGGSQADIPHAIAVDSSGSAYVCGYTKSSDFPTTTGALQTTFRGGSTDKDDGFVFKLDAQGSRLTYSTFLGGTDDESIEAIAVDSAGNAYVGGYTYSSNFPLTNGALQSTLVGVSDGFLAKINPTGSALAYSTLLGGTRSDGVEAVVLDASGNIYVGGSTASSNLPVVAPSQPASGGGADAFIFKLDPTGTKVLQGTYLGGSGDENLWAMAIDGSNNVFITGDTSSTDFPASRPSRYNGGSADAFVARLSFADQNLTLTVSPDKLLFQGDTGATLSHQTVNVAGVAGTSVAWKADVSGTAAAWLSISPKSGAGTGRIDVSVNTARLAAGTYRASIPVVNQLTGTTANVAVTLTLAKPPDPGGQIPQTGIVNAASFLGGAVAPGEMITIFGSGIGPAQLTSLSVGPDAVLAKVLAETRVLFDGVAAPLIYVSAGQVSAMVPYAVASKSSTVLQAEYKGLKSNPLTLPVAACAPAVFTADSSGKGQAAIANENGTYNSKDNPADRGSIITFYATGEGQTDPLGVDGKLAFGVYPKPVLPVTLQIGGVNADVLYYGAAPEAAAGVFQLNVKVPDAVAPGQQALILRVGSCTSPATVTMAVR